MRAVSALTAFAFAKKVMGSIVPLDGAKGMLHHLFAQLLHGVIPANVKHNPGLGFRQAVEIVGRRMRQGIGKGLQGIETVAVHKHRNIRGIRAKTHGFHAPALGTTVRAGTASFSAAVVRAAIGPLDTFEKLPAHGASNLAVGMAQETAHCPQMLELHPQAAALIAVRKYPSMQTSSDIFRLARGP